MNENELQSRLLHIDKIGVRLTRIMWALILGFGLSAILNMAAAAGSVFYEHMPEKVAETLYIKDFHFGTFSIDALKDSIEAHHLAGIGYLMYSLYSALIVMILSFYRKLIITVVRGGQPFTEEAGTMMKKYSYLTLFFIFSSNPIVTILLFMILRLFAVIFDYGAYLQKKANETNRIQEEMIMSFAEITENKSGQTGQHIRRVSEYSKIIAEELGLKDSQVEMIGLASTMHDIGKLIIPAEILDKPARLNDEEFATIKTHTTYGAALLSRVEGDIMQLSKTIALEHHERFDGNGYPLGKQGRAIAPESRIVAVADVYDALTSRRSYKKPWDPKDAYDEIVKNAGKQFDINVIEAFKSGYERIEETRERYADKDTVEDCEL
ncbi:HD domain-containing phosphohydrolase [Ruminococcus sp.]|uniref:HD-GYP domain-containing protein n=1 Tax=Ruminococcus sp. TaxID=41978 RepID=UPI0025910FD3|nr:HD domain-containing phosphohydrolase [Ruminococcus sp.]MCR5021685.1 HD domain-containing protein [Ruminococcus sp.]